MKSLKNVFADYIRENGIDSTHEIDLRSFSENTGVDFRQVMKMAKAFEKESNWKVVVGRRGMRTRLVPRGSNFAVRQKLQHQELELRASGSHLDEKNKALIGCEPDFVDVFFTIRLGVTVKIQLPRDITSDEIDRLANFVAALSIDN